MHWLPLILKLFAGAEGLFGVDLRKVFGKSQNAQVPQAVSTDSIICGNVPQSCEDNEYRTYDGTCNNLQHSWWGSSNSPYRRLLPSTYSDGVHAMPISETNDSLPNPRTCSLRAYVELDDPDVLWTLLFMQYGQIVAHDISLTAGVTQTDKGGIVCCENGQLTQDGQNNPRCAAVEIPHDDPYNAPEGIKCMDFFRTLTTSDLNCTGTSGVAEPVSAVTSYADMSFMYGSDNKTANRVREFKGGRLKFVIRKGIVLLPQDPDPLNACNVDVVTEPCYSTGDVRVNQNPELSILQNLYLAQHNNIANALAKVNPHWNDEKLYQETRKIMIAKHQFVMYYEFLPPILGDQNMKDNKLNYPGATGYISDYDPNVNAAASVEYATAGFRHFHTEIEGYLGSYKENRKESDSHVIRLYKWMNKPEICEQGNNFNGLTIGLATQAQSAVNRYHSNDMLNLLFAGKKKMGLDLKTIDIQRGRDHGVGGYAQVLSFFGIADIEDFKDFDELMPKEHRKILEDLYATVNDVDQGFGSSLENRNPDSLSTPTTRAVLTEQFKRTRIGDRCFFENGFGKCAMTPEQLIAIRSTTSIAELICNNPSITKIQREAFKLVSAWNPLEPCTKHKFNALPWKEKR